MLKKIFNKRILGIKLVHIPFISLLFVLFTYNDLQHKREAEHHQKHVKATHYHNDKSHDSK